MNNNISANNFGLDQILTSVTQKAGMAKFFIFGDSNSGKIKTALFWIKELLDNGTPQADILLVTPQKSYQKPYKKFFEYELQLPFDIQSATLSGLSRRYLDVYWPLVLGDQRYPFTPQPPTFLTLETAQYFMMSIVKEKLNQGKFVNILLDPNRLTSQLLDNLNKSAMVGFDPSVIDQKLSNAWSGDKKYLLAYADMQETILEFRKLCFNKTLIDFSLQLELFYQVLWQNQLFKEKFTDSHQHLIVDHVEEDVPITHDLLLDWIPNTKSSFVIYNTDGGYRTMLGADPLSAKRVYNVCEERFHFETSIINNATIAEIRSKAIELVDENIKPEFSADFEIGFNEHFSILYSKYFPGLIELVADEIVKLIKVENVLPSEIAVLAPYVNDTLILALGERLEQRGLLFSSLRPSRTIIDNPHIRALLTVAKLCYPGIGITVSRDEFSKALFVLIDGMDLIRASLLAEIVLRANNELSEFSKINEKMRDRIMPQNGSSYERLRQWIENQKLHEPQPLDILIRKSFGELFSTNGFTLSQPSIETGKVADLIESTRKFRSVVSNRADDEFQNFTWLAKEYLLWIENGMLSGVHGNQTAMIYEDELTLMPATTFVMAGKSVQAQFWIDIGSQGWFERVDQPLTHPFVLSRNWPDGKKWTDTDEFNNNKASLEKIFKGLLGLASDKVYFCYSQYGESGFEQNGMLLRVIQKIRN